MGKRFEHLPREILEELFVKENLTYEQIAEKLGITINELRCSLRFYGLRKNKEQRAEISRKGINAFLSQNGKAMSRVFEDGELEELYIKQNLGMKEIAKIKGITSDAVRYAVEKSGLKKSWKARMEVRKNNLLREFGVENVMQLQAVKDKVVETNLREYGETSPMKNPDIVKKRNKTNLEKYGDENPMRTNAVKAKRVRTTQERYGVDNIAQLEEVRRKEREYYYCPEVWDAVVDKEKFIEEIKKLSPITLSTIAKKFNCTPSTAKHLVEKFDCADMVYFGNYKTFPEVEIGEFLDSIGVEYRKDKSTLWYKNQNGRKCYLEIDLYAKEYNIGIEFNGVYWHRVQRKNKHFHMKKSKMAEDKGIFIFHVYEFEWVESKDEVLCQIRALFSPQKIIPKEKFLIVSSQDEMINKEVWVDSEKVYSFRINIEYFQKEKVLLIKNLRIYSSIREDTHLSFLDKIAIEHNCQRIKIKADYGKIPSSFFDESGFEFVKYEYPEMFFVHPKCLFHVSDENLSEIKHYEEIDNIELYSNGREVEGSGFKIYEKILK